MRDGRLPSLLLVVVMCASCSASPAAPSNGTDAANLPVSIAIGNVGVKVTSSGFSRDWMPIVQKPGPDGGSPLMGAIRVVIGNSGAAGRLTFTGTFWDLSGTSYPATSTAMNWSTGKDWDGTIPASAQLDIQVALRDGPYLPLNSRVFAVLTWTDQSGRTVSMRTEEGLIGGTY